MPTQSPTPQRRPKTRIQRAAIAFPVILRYTALVVLVGMVVAWYLTSKLNVYLLASFLSLAGGAEGAEFVRDVLTGAITVTSALAEVNRKRKAATPSRKKQP